ATPPADAADGTTRLADLVTVPSKSGHTDVAGSVPGQVPLGQALGGITPPREVREDLAAVRGVAREKRQLDAGLADGHVRRLPLVLDLDDVDPLLRKERQELRELAGPVGHARPQDEVAPGGGEPVAHHRDEQRRVDVAAGEKRHDGAASAD